MAAKTDESKTKIYLFAALLIPNLVTGIGSYYAGKNNEDRLESDQLKTAYEQISKLTKESDSQRKANYECAKEKLELYAKILEKSDDFALLEGLLDSLPFPAWIKRQRDDGEFEMVFINEAYTVEFAITKSEYIGYTDNKVHGKELADEFKKNDLFVLETKRHLKTIEKATSRGIEKEILVYKFMFALPSGEDGIGGVSIHDLTQKCADSLKELIEDSYVF